ncbi:MAG: GGDEF domain-containing phosphodiesterase [Halofilum sp. (in: g-proteobacteria)]|nr:GGDEF domain-containing phosphodiesterase [Halofilum sp. (in: g-proteobacteria)]
MEARSRALAWIDALRRSRNVSDPLIAGLIVALLAGATALVYATGGTKLAWPYLMLVPVLIAAARWHVIGGLVTGLVGGFLLGPFMPLDVAQGIPQGTDNWLVRLAFYTFLGGFTGALFAFIQREGDRRAQEARTDTDSGLPNKTALIEDIERLQMGHVRRSPLAFLVRITNLAEIINALGVSSGEEVVRALRQRIHDRVGTTIRIYRFSASELALVAQADTGDASELSRAIRKSIEEPLEASGIPVHAEVMIGSAGGDEPMDAHELVRRARAALVSARDVHAGFHHYRPEREAETGRTVELLGRVRRALRDGEFELHYQPKIKVADHAVSGCEALIRWRDASGELIPPGTFMPRVERSALIGSLTRFVVHTACEFAQRGEGHAISVNFSAHDLLDRELATTLADLVSAECVDAGHFEIEITEGAVIRDPEAAREAIGRLREQGFLVSIDDFGTGYSSFEYLRLLPLTGLKIDRAFVNDLEHDRRARDLMQCMIQVGHALDLEVVAEGVENSEQVDILQQLGCDLIQGFHYARPMAESDYLHWGSHNGWSCRPSGAT